MDRVDLRLTPVANGVASLYGGYMSVIKFLYSCSNSFNLLLQASHVSCCFHLFSRFAGGYQCISNQASSEYVN